MKSRLIIAPPCSGKSHLTSNSKKGSDLHQELLKEGVRARKFIDSSYGKAIYIVDIDSILMPFFHEVVAVFGAKWMSNQNAQDYLNNLMDGLILPDGPFVYLTAQTGQSVQYAGACFMCVIDEYDHNQNTMARSEDKGHGYYPSLTAIKELRAVYFNYLGSHRHDFIAFYDNLPMCVVEAASQVADACTCASMVPGEMDPSDVEALINARRDAEYLVDQMKG